MDTSLFDYDLPASAIAQTPAERRDQSRLLLVDRAAGRLSHHVFSEFPALLPENSWLFRNNVRVLKARLRAQKPSGGQVECLLLRPAAAPDEWWCLLKPGRRLKPGAVFGQEGLFSATVTEKTPEGECRVAFKTENNLSVLELAERIGEMPLPHYIRREAGQPADEERYQTVYANPAKTCAAAAPTAGLHFTPDLLSELEHRRVPIHDLTLHIGLGTFKPITADRIEEHNIHREHYEIGPETIRALRPAEAKTRVAIGTTSARAMEDFFKKQLPDSEYLQGFSAEADIFIYPPASFAAVDALLTNFHLPGSTLMCLVAAFLAPGGTTGIKWLKEIYFEAIAKGYRFYSYGDAMLIV